MSTRDVDLRKAINAISDVIQNRPRPLREFDQIYMKAADMVVQSEIIADWADNKSVAFIGDGDAISVCIAYLKSRGIFDHGPAEIVIFDFDERIRDSIERFAEKEGIENIRTVKYNCIDEFPEPDAFDCYYTNPPWGASNDGESVKLFSLRGMEAVGYSGEGAIVIADDDELEWCQKVLAATQIQALQSGFYVQRMMRKTHEYHLDDAPNLRSCNLFVRSLPDTKPPGPSQPILEKAQLERFYGREKHLRVRYVNQRKRLDYGKAHEDEYSFVMLEDEE